MQSEVCLSDLSGDVEVVLQTSLHLEAPNWHRDGYLILNGGGRLWRLPLETGELGPIDTGFAARLNNDHGLSPDGTTLAISDATEEGKSCIYLLPVGGGQPGRVTGRVPSWWHGWSPDGQRLAYAAARGGPVTICTCRLDGSDEVELTPGFDHCDGPDYSADGEWVWFNGERDGSVDLWRVRPHGSDLERMTREETVDWFPHPSPCGRHLVYLAYPPGTKGHPGEKDVALRLMPQDGGESREIVRLHGGQGTINVPSWAPDGERFAFVRYG